MQFITIVLYNLFSTAKEAYDQYEILTNLSDSSPGSLEYLTCVWTFFELIPGRHIILNVIRIPDISEVSYKTERQPTVSTGDRR